MSDKLYLGPSRRKQIKQTLEKRLSSNFHPKRTRQLKHLYVFIKCREYTIHAFHGLKCALPMHSAVFTSVTVNLVYILWLLDETYCELSIMDSRGIPWHTKRRQLGLRVSKSTHALVAPLRCTNLAHELEPAFGDAKANEIPYRYRFNASYNASSTAFCYCSRSEPL